MRINKMTDYAIRAVRAIYQENGQVITSKNIAAKENIPQGILMKVLSILKRNGIVDSHQGRGEITGGFSLAREPQELTVLDIIEAIEGTVEIHRYIGDPREPRENKCKVYFEFEKINETIKSEFRNYTLDRIF